MTERMFNALPADVSHADVMKHWLCGTTCSGKNKEVRQIVAENAAYILLKHRSHPEYSGRMLGSGTCGVYVELYQKASFLTAVKDNWRGVRYGNGQVVRWEGRQFCNIAKILQELEMAGLKLTLVKQ